MNRPLVIGTRGSALARAQTGLVHQALLSIHPLLEVEVREIRTLGDKRPGIPTHRADSPGIFVKELEEYLLRSEIDLAVHSMKDLPTKITAGTRIASVPRREDPRDVLVSRTGKGLAELAPGTVVGTGSPRRKAQLLAYRKDIEIRPIRGNVDTRLRKVEEGVYDAVVLAAAGLHRLGRHEDITQYLPPEIILPEVGQGALALQVRADDRKTQDLVHPLNDPATEAAVTAERAFLELMGGGCALPVTAFARVEENVLFLEAMVAADDGSSVLRTKTRGRLEEPRKAAWMAAESLRQMGALELVQSRSGVLDVEAP